MNPDGSLNYSQTIALASTPESRTSHTSYEDTIPLKKRFPSLKHYFPKPSIEETELCVSDTHEVIKNIIAEKLGILDAKDEKDQVTYVKYESNSIIQPEGGEEGSRGRTVEIRNFQEDPMLPPKFKLRKNRHKEPSPPPPILKKAEPVKTVTKEEREKWNIPAAISNWKNNQGFTISLDKRMMAANGGSQQTSEEMEELLNIEKFGDLSQALENADKQAREEITIRNTLMREQAIKDQQEKDQKIRELAEISRRERNKRSTSDDQQESKKRKY